MRYLLLTFAALSIQPSYADAPKFDNDLALGLAHAYIESFVRLNLTDLPPTLAWDQSITDYVAFEHESYGGFIAVFVPDTTGTGYGTAYFQVGAHAPGHIFPLQWGYMRSQWLTLSDAKRAFEKGRCRGRRSTLVKF